MVWLFIFAAALAVVWRTLTAPSRLMLRVLLDEMGPAVIVHLYLIDGLVNIRFWFPAKNARKRRKSRIDRRTLLRALHREIERQNLLGKLRVALRLHVRLGCGDAAQTAMLCAGVGALAQGLLGWLKTAVSTVWQECRICPEFQKNTLRVQFSCMITAKTGNIIAVALMLPLKLLGGKKQA
jgi:hypothetical protein